MSIRKMTKQKYGADGSWLCRELLTKLTRPNVQMPIKKEDFSNVWMFWLTDKTRLLGQLRKLCRGGQSHLHSIQLNIQTIPSVFCSLCYVCLYSTLTGSQICVFFNTRSSGDNQSGTEIYSKCNSFCFGPKSWAFDMDHKAQLFICIIGSPLEIMLSWKSHHLSYVLPTVSLLKSCTIVK